MILDYMLDHTPVMLILLTAAAVVGAVLGLVWVRLRRPSRSAQRR